MRNSSFFEKLTGSLKLSEEDLESLNEGSHLPHTKKSPKKKHEIETETVVIEDNHDFEIPDDAEVETIEEIIEDENIDHEEVEEYYEEILDDEEEDTLPVHQYPVFHITDLPRDHENQRDTEYESPSHDHFPIPVDVFEMHHEIVLRVLVPGITPENLKVSITRNHVSLACTRPAPEGIPEQNYFEREIPYGEFERTVHLPSDVDVEHAEAVEKYGLLIIRLPKLDAKKVQELKIKSA
jgi:HSP20 family protein